MAWERETLLGSPGGCRRRRLDLKLAKERMSRKRRPLTLTPFFFPLFVSLCLSTVFPRKAFPQKKVANAIPPLLASREVSSFSCPPS